MYAFICCLHTGVGIGEGYNVTSGLTDEIRFCPHKSFSNHHPAAANFTIGSDPSSDLETVFSIQRFDPLSGHIKDFL